MYTWKSFKRELHCVHVHPTHNPRENAGMATFQLVHSHNMQYLMENSNDVDEAVLLHALIDVFACEMHPFHVVVTE